MLVTEKTSGGYQGFWPCPYLQHSKALPKLGLLRHPAWAKQRRSDPFLVACGESGDLENARWGESVEVRKWNLNTQRPFPKPRLRVRLMARHWVSAVESLSGGHSKGRARAPACILPWRVAINPNFQSTWHGDMLFGVFQGLGGGMTEKRNCYADSRLHVVAESHPSPYTPMSF